MWKAVSHSAPNGRDCLSTWYVAPGQRGCKRGSYEAATVCTLSPFPKGLSVEAHCSNDAYLTPPIPTPFPRALHASGSKALRRSPQPFGASIHLLTRYVSSRARGEPPARARGASRHTTGAVTSEHVIRRRGGRAAGLRRPAARSRVRLPCEAERRQGREAPASIHEQSRAEQSIVVQDRHVTM